MTRSRFYAAAFPIWAILYVMGIVIFRNHTFTTVGALVFALIAVVGATVIRPGEGEGRERDRKRNRG